MVVQPRLTLRLAQKQILTPGLVQMVTVLALNKLELKEMISQELVENPVLEETAEEENPEDRTSEELSLEGERQADPADHEIMEAADAEAAADGIAEAGEAEPAAEALSGNRLEPATPAPAETPEAAKDPFDEIDFGSFFDEYLDPGYKSPASEAVERPSFEAFLASPTSLSDHLNWQLSLLLHAGETVAEAAGVIIGNLDDDGYLTARLEEVGQAGNLKIEDVETALKLVQEFDPIGVAARDLRECLQIQLRGAGAEGGVAWRIVEDHLPLLQNRDLKGLARALGRPLAHVETAVEMIKKLDPTPGRRYSIEGTRVIEPDVAFVKVTDGYQVVFNDEDMPQLRLNRQYRDLLGRDGNNKEVRNYVKERYTSALQLMRNIEQRKQTILKVCLSIIARQTEFLDHGVDCLRPMMIKEVAEEVGVHPSTVSRAVANKYAHTPQGVYGLRFFFSEAVQGPAGESTSLINLKRRVKKMIEEEDAAHPLTDDQVTRILETQGINVTRRTVAKYREDLKIPSTHQRRVKS